MSASPTLPPAAHPDRAVDRQAPLGNKDLSIPHLSAVLAVEAVAKVGALDRVLVLGDGPAARAAIAVAGYWGAEVVTGSIPDGGFDVVIRTRPAALPPKALRPFARVVDLGPAANAPLIGLPEVAENLAVTRFAVRLEVYHEHAPETLRRAGRRVLELRQANVLPRPIPRPSTPENVVPLRTRTPAQPLRLPLVEPPNLPGGLSPLVDMIRRLL